MMAETYYAIEKFAEADRALSSIIETMPIKRRAIDVYREKSNIPRAKETLAELESIRQKLLDIIRELGLLFLECDMAECAAYANKLYGAVKAFKLMTPDYGKLVSTISMLREHIPRTETVNASLIGHLMNNVKMGYYPTDLAHVKLMRNALKFPESRVNLLDPCCGCGLALEALASEANAVTYGTEIDESRGAEAETRLDRVGFGSYFHSRISSEAFHVLFLNPPYLNVIGEGGVKARSEKRFLVESMRHLIMGGILLYIIPYYRLTHDICRVLCDNFTDISVYRFLDAEFAKFKQIVVFGVRKKKDDGSEQAEILSKYALSPESIPTIDALPTEVYHISTTEKSVEIFKGANFNLGELQRQLAKSKSIDRFFEKSWIDAMEKRPLLPLSLGQVGLIGGSGLINGYVACDNPHVIKGRVIKEIKRRENEEEGTVTETKVNRMLFNILTPDGVKHLA